MKTIFLTTFLFLIFNIHTDNDFLIKLSNAALSIIDSTIIYDPSYQNIKYPLGDISPKKGVCTDVIIRSYRKLGIDLQQLVHEDMKKNFNLYPKIWGLKKPDSNIDHRRVPNLQIFFERKGKKLSHKINPLEFQPGDIVTWMIGNKLPHIGIVTNKKSLDGKRPLIVHNIGNGQVLEDCLLSYELTGRYQYLGK